MNETLSSSVLLLLCKNYLNALSAANSMTPFTKENKGSSQLGYLNSPIES